MSIKFALLSLLDRGPTGAAALRRAFHEAGGEIWSLNIGQVSTTLDRLVRDELVTPLDETPADSPQLYKLTDAGYEALQGWFSTPVDRSQVDRDELAIKLAMVKGTQTTLREVVRVQRLSTMGSLRELTLRARELREQGRSSSAECLLVQRQLFQLDAELRWLDHVEATT